MISAAAAVRRGRMGGCELQRYLKYTRFYMGGGILPRIAPGAPAPPDLTSNYLLILR